MPACSLFYSIYIYLLYSRTNKVATPFFAQPPVSVLFRPAIAIVAPSRVMVSVTTALSNRIFAAVDYSATTVAAAEVTDDDDDDAVADDECVDGGDGCGGEWLATMTIHIGRQCVRQPLSRPVERPSSFDLVSAQMPT